MCPFSVRLTSMHLPRFSVWTIPFSTRRSIFYPIRGFVDTLLYSAVLGIAPLMYRHAIMLVICLHSIRSLILRNIWFSTAGGYKTANSKGIRQ